MREIEPALLISYYYWKNWDTNHMRKRYDFRHYILDSGAFTAKSKNIEIDLVEYTDFCLELQETDPKLKYIFALDVIGNGEQSLKNCRYMNDRGVPALPTFHVGSPEELLADMAVDYDFIALGGMVGYYKKRQFVEQCFARLWPKKIHGFGIGGEKLIMDFPWYSVDASNWETGPCKFGRWKAFGGSKMPIRGSDHDLRTEVDAYLDLEKRAQHKWRRIWKGDAPIVHLAVAPMGTERVRYDRAFKIKTEAA